MDVLIPAAPISPLRQRLIDDMTMRRFAHETQRNYIRDVGRFATFLGRSPATATSEDVRRFQVEQQDAGVPVPTMNGIVSALRFLFTHTLDRPDLARKLVRVTHPRKLPVVLSLDEVARLLGATTCLKHQAALSVAYGAGLRVAEVAHLKISDIDSERMLIRVERGKGGQYRNAMLAADLLTLLREWWRVGRQQGVMHPTWLAEREADLLPVGYFHVVFTLPAELADIAWQNKAVVYDLLFRAASETMLTIAADPKHLGARIGITAVLHTWGSAMTHHPRVHMIVPGGGFSLDGSRWIASKPAFLLPVRVLGKLFRRLFLTRLTDLRQAGKLAFFGSQADLADRRRFRRHLAPVRKKRWVVYAKAPFAGPEAVLAYLSRYTHRVAISNQRLIGFDETSVTFRYKDYRRSGPERQQVMTLETDDFIRRFLLHVLPRGFHRIRHYGLLASVTRKANVARARELLAVPPPPDPVAIVEPPDQRPPCPCCGGRMRIETFERWMQPRAPPHASPTTGAPS